MQSIPLIDLKGQFESIKDQVIETVTRVLHSQRFILGPEVEAFENEMSSVCRTQFAVGVASGTDALLIALKAMGIGPGHEVIVPSYTFFSSVSTIVHVGAKPVFVDINPQTYNIDPQAVNEAITEKTRAIVPVHLFGQCADMDPILKIAEAKNLMVLEDACQAVCATYNGRTAGSMGHTAALSFYPSKNLGGYGDGGMILTQSKQIREAVRSLRIFGASAGAKDIGYNSRLDEIQAAVLRIKLKHLPDWIEARQDNAKTLDQGLEDTPLTLPQTAQGATHTYSNYIVRAPQRDELKQHLEQQGIGTAVYYLTPLHHMDCFAKFVPKGTALTETDRASKQTLALPVFPELTEQELSRIIKAVREFYSV